MAVKFVIQNVNQQNFINLKSLFHCHLLSCIIKGKQGEDSSNVNSVKRDAFDTNKEFKSTNTDVLLTFIGHITRINTYVLLAF